MTDDDNEDEREALRSENLGLRGEVKRLENLLKNQRYHETSPEASIPRSSAPELRSSMRSSDTEGKVEPKRITFSRPNTHSSKRTSVVSSERPSLNQRTGSDRLSVTFGDLPENWDSRKRVSSEGLLSPTRKSISLHTAALVLNAVRTFKASIRKTRAKQSLFKVARDPNQPWSLKFAAAETYTPDPQSVGFITEVITGIDVCRSVIRHNPDLLRAIATRMIGIQVNLGDTVCRQGEPGLYFMVVDGGEFVAESLGHPSRDLRKGETFGEAVFIHPSPVSSMSVTCTSPAGGSLWVIHRDALGQVVKQSSIKLVQLARETLDSSPKILRDSINAVQMAAACKAAEFTYVSAGEQLNAPTDGLVLSVSGSVKMGSVVLSASQIVVEKDSVFLTISKREIDSIPPLSVALSAIMRNTISGDASPVLTIESVATPSSLKPTLPSLRASRMSLDSGIHDVATTGHPLSPSLRPNLTEMDVSKILIFNLLSISARTHLVNKVQLVTIPYNSADGHVPLDLGIILMLNGTALVKSESSSITLHNGHCVGFGEITSGKLRGQVVVEAVSDFLDLDEVVASPPPPVVIAHWSMEVILGALPSELQSQPNEGSVISYLKKRKLLVRNPIFQFLSEASLSSVIAASSTVPLDHKDTLSAMVGPDQSFAVTDGSVVTTAPDIEGQTYTFGDFFCPERLVAEHHDTVDDETASNKSQASEQQLSVSAKSVRAEILVISRQAFAQALNDLPDKADVLKHIQEYLERMRRRVELHDVKIGRTIGRGGTAVVKLACIPKEDALSSESKLYALKIIKKKLLIDHHKYALLKNEKTLLQQLDSPFIIQLKSVFKDARNIYLMLELAPGGDLLTALNNLGVLNRQQAQLYSACMVAALEYCHSKEIVYRDLKPENLLIDAQGYLKLSDFGVGKKLAKPTTYTLVGTPQFMAPEIILGKGYGVSCDAWSLGCCLYEMMVGELPFSSPDSDDSGSQFELFQKIVQFDISSVTLNVDDSSRSILSGLLRTDPHTRIGCSIGIGIGELRTNPFFSPVEESPSAFSWTALEARTLSPPFVPQLAPVVFKRPLSTGSTPDMISEVGTDDNAPNASPTLSAISWTNLGHSGRDTTLSWDLNF